MLSCDRRKNLNLGKNHFNNTVMYLLEILRNLEHQLECISAIKRQNQAAISNQMMMERGKGRFQLGTRK